MSRERAPAGPAAPHRRKVWAWVRDLGLVVLLWGAVQAYQTRSVPQGPAPAFEGELAGGGRMSLAAWQDAHPGRAVGLYFWAQWCPVCKAQAGGITSLSADWPILTVAMQSGDAGAVRAALAELGADWPTLVDAQGALAALYGVRAVPTLIVLGPDGRISAAVPGFSTRWGLALRFGWAQYLGG